MWVLMGLGFNGTFEKIFFCRLSAGVSLTKNSTNKNVIEIEREDTSH